MLGGDDLLNLNLPAASLQAAGERQALTDLDPQGQFAATVRA